MGNVDDFLWINETSGDIYVTATDSFDYHRQNVIFVQVNHKNTQYLFFFLSRLTCPGLNIN